MKVSAGLFPQKLTVLSLETSRVAKLPWLDHSWPSSFLKGQLSLLLLL